MGTGRKTKHGVLICGAYGISNAGDEAVLEAILNELREIDPEMPVTVLSRAPEKTQAAHCVASIHSFNLPGFWKAARKAELYINGGGSLIQDVTSSRSLWYYLFTICAARLLGCRVMMYGCGVGPVNRAFNRRLAGRVIDRNVEAITLREARSMDTLRDMGVHRPEMELAAEPALSLEPAEESETDALMKKHGLQPNGRYFCLSIRRWPGIQQKAQLFAAAADYAWEKYGMTPVLFAVNLEQDVEIARHVAELTAQSTPCLVVTDSLSAGENIGFFSRMSVVMAMRLHALIFSAAQAVPLIGISYDPKVSSFLDSAGQTNYIAYEALSAPEQLYRMIDEAALSDREALRSTMKRLRERERINVEIARKLLKK